MNAGNEAGVDNVGHDLDGNRAYQTGHRQEYQVFQELGTLSREGLWVPVEASFFPIDRFRFRTEVDRHGIHGVEGGKDNSRARIGVG